MLDRPRPTSPHLTSSSLTYYAAVASYRAPLLSRFGLVHDRVTAGLKRALNATDVRYLPGNKTSVPGFHIIPSHLAWSRSLFRFHYDESFTSIMSHVVEANGVTEIDESGCDAESRVSFTLAVALPAKGSGLNYADFGGADNDECRIDNPTSPHRCYDLKRQEYEVGSMVVHAGRLVHSIGEWEYGGAGKNRITMQGFGFKCGGSGIEGDGKGDRWYIYW